MATSVILNFPKEKESPGIFEDLLKHLRRKREQLREHWVRRISEERLLRELSTEEIETETDAVYDGYLEALRAAGGQTFAAQVRKLSERVISKRIEAYQIVGILLLLRDVVARSLFENFQSDLEKLRRVLDEYEPVANQIANLVAVGLVRERERRINQQQEAIKNLSTRFFRLMNGY